MNPAVDQFGKVTVSLGGRCPLGCRHCYVNASAFSSDPKRSVAQTVAILQNISSPFGVVCLSGDVDCFLRPQLARELLERISEEFPEVDILYTTRLIPPDDIISALRQLGAELAERERLLIPCVSFVSPHFPNPMEDAVRVASTHQRVELLRDLSHERQPSIAALRPTFPFDVVPRSDVYELISRCAPHASAVLGETFILDSAGEIAAKVGVAPELDSDEISKLTFLNQTSVWRKRLLKAETSFAALTSKAHNRPYFLRSISAVSYFRAYWDLYTGTSRYQRGEYLDTSAELVRP